MESSQRNDTFYKTGVSQWRMVNFWYALKEHWSDNDRWRLTHKGWILKFKVTSFQGWHWYIHITFIIRLIDYLLFSSLRILKKYKLKIQNSYTILTFQILIFYKIIRFSQQFSQFNIDGYLIVFTMQLFSMNTKSDCVFVCYFVFSRNASSKTQYYAARVVRTSPMSDKNTTSAHNISFYLKDYSTPSVFTCHVDWISAEQNGKIVKGVVKPNGSFSKSEKTC